MKKKQICYIRVPSLVLQMTESNDSEVLGFQPDGTTFVPSGQEGQEGRKINVSDYLTIRLTISHVDVPRYLEKIFGEMEYICYKHKGAKTHKEHIHVLVPDVDSRARIKSKLQYYKFKGNQDYSIKVMHNGLVHGIQYGSKEGTVPIVHGPFEDLIKVAPPWQETRMEDHFKSFDDVDPKKIRDWQLCYSNCVGVMVHHAKKSRQTHLSFDDCFEDLVQTTNWKPNIQMQQKGISPFMRSDYEVRLGKRQRRDFDFLHKWNA